MRHTLYSLLCFVALCFAADEANAQVETSPNSKALLSQLAQSKLSKTQPILEALVQKDDPRVVALFEAMLAGKLYIIKETQEFVSVVKANQQYQAKALFSDKPTQVLSKKDIKKVRVNNKLRVYLRQAIALLQIKHPQPDKRLAAVRQLYGKLSADTAFALGQAREQEQDSDVSSAMDLAIALFQAKSADQSLQLEAIDVMRDSLDSQARNALSHMATEERDPAVQQAAHRALRNILARLDFYSFLHQLFFGLSLGSVLLLAAIGLAITFGVMGVINMAHGEMMMLGAYTTYVIQLLMPNAIEYSLLISVPAAFLVAALVGILIERSVIRFLQGRPLETLLATFGISLILQQLARSIFSPLNRQVQTPIWMSGSWDINPALSLTLNRLYIFAFALATFACLLLILKKTSLGLNVRAISQNRDMAKAMGIRTDRTDALTFGLGSGIAGIAGVALSQLTNVGPNLGQSYIIDSFMVVVFGGVGNLWGTLVAAFSLGVVNKFLEPAIGAVLASILVLVFIILFIQKKPQGLFPQKGRAAE